MGFRLLCDRAHDPSLPPAPISQRDGEGGGGGGADADGMTTVISTATPALHVTGGPNLVLTQTASCCARGNTRMSPGAGAGEGGGGGHPKMQEQHLQCCLGRAWGCVASRCCATSPALPLRLSFVFLQSRLTRRHPIGGVFAQRVHSTCTAPIITVIIQVTTLKTNHLRSHAQSIQNSKIQTSDACHGSQGPKFCPL